MFDNTKQNNNQNQEPTMPVAPPENINERIARLHEQGKSRGNKKAIILAIVLFIIIAGGASAGFMYWDKISGFLGLNENICDYNNPDKRYEYKDLETCTRADMGCKENEKPFTDECGCGCEVNKVENVACQADAKLCSDGSSVGRVAPDCEFAECPEIEENGINRELSKYSTKENCETEKNDQCFYFDCNNPSISTTDTLFPLICGEPYNPDKFWISQKQASETCHNWCDEKYGKSIPYDPSNLDVGVGMTAGENCYVGCAIPQDNFNENSDTSNWQTYRNEEYGFEVKYPEDFMEQETASDNNLFYLKGLGDRSSEDINISLRNNYQVSQITSSVDAEAINVDGRSGYKYFFQEGIGHSGVALIQLEQDAIEIIYDFIGNNDSEISKEEFVQNNFNQILSTFKFLIDTDNDGLYDDEEEKYGTDINNSDSDGDGYLDGSEVENGFNPMGAGKLESI